MIMDFFGVAMDSTVEFFGNIADFLSDNLISGPWAALITVVITATVLIAVL